MTISPPVELTLAITDSDQVRDLATGRVAVEGVALRTTHHPVEEIFFRHTKYREWDVSELSLGKFFALKARGDSSLVGLPVFPSRAFRHSEIFVRPDGPVDRPAELAGARIGFPEWTVTATVYQRALLQHEYGIDLTGVRWVQGGINEPGRIETLPVGLPGGVTVRAENERSLNDLLVDGELDAIIVPHPPVGATDGSGRIVQLFGDSQAVEQEYYARTGIFPIMHIAVLDAAVHARHPWIAGNLVSAFTRAKDNSLARLQDPTAPQFPLPWGAQRARHAAATIGQDFWPYGVEANRTTLEAFARYAHEQALTDRELRMDDLFPSSLLETFRI
jgi:4,5-dihydroxyphthalate decarboxylase